MPLSKDIRERIVTLYQSGATQIAIAERLLIAQSSVSRILKRHRKTGSLEVGISSGRPRKFSPEDDAFIAQKVKQTPDITLHELIQAVADELGKKVSITVIQRSLKRLNHSRKKRVSTTRAKMIP